MDDHETLPLMLPASPGESSGESGAHEEDNVPHLDLSDKGSEDGGGDAEGDDLSVGSGKSERMKRKLAKKHQAPLPANLQLEFTAEQFFDHTPLDDELDGVDEEVLFHYDENYALIQKIGIGSVFWPADVDYDPYESGVHGIKVPPRPTSAASVRSFVLHVGSPVTLYRACSCQMPVPV